MLEKMIWSVWPWVCFPCSRPFTGWCDFNLFGAVWYKNGFICRSGFQPGDLPVVCTNHFSPGDLLSLQYVLNKRLVMVLFYNVLKAEFDILGHTIKSWSVKILQVISFFFFLPKLSMLVCWAAGASSRSKATPISSSSNGSSCKHTVLIHI